MNPSCIGHLFSDIQEIILIVYPDSTRICKANPAALQFYGYTLKEIQNKSLRDITCCNLDTLDNELAKLKDGIPVKYFSKHLTHDNKEIEVEVHAGRLSDAKSCYYFIVFNVSPLLWTENLLTTRLRFEKAISECSHLLLVKDDETALTGSLSILCEVANVSRVYIFENLINEKEQLCMRQTHEVCAKGIEPQIGNPILQQLPYQEGFLRWKDELIKGIPIMGLVDNFPKDEQDILRSQHIDSTLVLPINVDQKWYGFIGFDAVHEKRNWEKEDIDLLSTIAHMIGSHLSRQQKSKELNALLSRLQLSNRALQDFAHSVSHDLKSPLRGIYAISNWLKEDLSKILLLENHQTILEHIELMQRQLIKSEEQISSILDHSRADRIHETRTELNLNQLLEDILSQLLIPQNITIQLPNPFPPVNTEPTRIKQILQNLIDNAIKYCDKTKGVITIDLFQDRDTWGCSVQDNGKGIPKEHQKDIFNLYYQVDSETKSNGSGIGLHLVQKNIMIRGGAIDVQSTPGEGSVFSFTLPK
jgi:PAS domain S-box-containing protein